MPPTARAASCENRRAVKTAVAVAGRALTPWYCEVCDVEFGSAQVCSVLLTACTAHCIRTGPDQSRATRERDCNALSDGCITTCACMCSHLPCCTCARRAGAWRPPQQLIRAPGQSGTAPTARPAEWQRGWHAESCQMHQGPGSARRGRALGARVPIPRGDGGSRNRGH